MKKGTTSNLERIGSDTLNKTFGKIDEVGADDAQKVIQAVPSQAKISQE
jgi:hypothetical protein